MAVIQPFLTVMQKTALSHSGRKPQCIRAKSLQEIGRSLKMESLQCDVGLMRGRSFLYVKVKGGALELTG